MSETNTAARTRKPRDPNAPKQERKPAGPKRVFALVQVLNEDGSTMEIPRGRVHVISFEKSAEEVLVKMDDKDKYPNAVYLTGMLPAGR